MDALWKQKIDAVIKLAPEYGLPTDASFWGKQPAIIVTALLNMYNDKDTPTPAPALTEAGGILTAEQETWMNERLAANHHALDAKDNQIEKLEAEIEKLKLTPGLRDDKGEYCGWIAPGRCVALAAAKVKYNRLAVAAQSVVSEIRQRKDGTCCISRLKAELSGNNKEKENTTDGNTIT